MQTECGPANNAQRPYADGALPADGAVARSRVRHSCGSRSRLDRPNDMNPTDGGPSRAPPGGLDRRRPYSVEKTVVTNRPPPDVRACDETDEFERGLGAVLNDWNARGDRSCSR